MERALPEKELGQADDMKQWLHKVIDWVSLPLCRTPLALRVLRVVSYQRTRAMRRLLEERLRAEGAYGDVVLQGPLAGLLYPPGYASCRFETIIGAYEHEIMPWLSELVKTRRYSTIINVGAAEGYFTVGLARLFPDAKVLSYETDPAWRAYCVDMANRNGVAERVAINGTCALDEFIALAPTGPTLVMMDIDLGELQLLDPNLVPWLKQVDVLVETHDCLKVGTTQAIRDRFIGSHDIRQVTSSGLDYKEFPILRPLLLEEIYALTNEDRRGLQDWLLMQPKP